MLNTVKVPPQFAPLFEKAQEYVNRYFQKQVDDPTRGAIEIFGQRYILVRAASMSVDFFDTVKKLYQDQHGETEALGVARQLLFDIAHAIGKQDAKNFSAKMGLKDPIEKLSAGPVHFAYTGWAFVDIFPESDPQPNENYYLIYDHPYSFESDSWIQSGQKPAFPVCIMNAGYSSGWCEESFGVTLVASEIMCRARGDKACRFIMAPPARIEQRIAAYLHDKPELAKKVTYEIPGFFKIKQQEEERARLTKALEESEHKYRTLLNNMPQKIFYKDMQSTYLLCNYSYARDLGINTEDIKGKTDLDFYSKELAEKYAADDQRIMRSGEKEEYDEEYLADENKNKRYVHTIKAPVRDEGGKVIGVFGTFWDISDRKHAELEVAKKVAELEKMNGYMVNRELRMIELKKEIRELRADAGLMDADAGV